MQPFELPLVDQGIVTGIHNIPPCGSSHPRFRPLVVALHGATFDCRYFDANSSSPASTVSSALGFPFISIDRPGYGKTPSFRSIPEGSNFPKETGLWLHRHSLPSLWSTYGTTNQCTCIVLLCHSLGAMGGIVAAALHGQDNDSSYPLGGLIVSGLGHRLLSSMQEDPFHEPNFSLDRVLFPLGAKNNLMFRPGTVTPEVLELAAQLNVPAPFAELESLRRSWLPCWRNEWAHYVKVPVMLGIAENDCFFEGTEQHVKDCLTAFRSSPRTDGSLLRKAPHCLELSYWSHGWYAHCFGFAVECSATFAAETLLDA